MNEKRFVLIEDDLEPLILDNKETMSVNEVVDVLNEQQELIEEKSNVIILMGAFIKSKGFSVDDFDEWLSKDWHNAEDMGSEISEIGRV